jgi:MFS superfamily sulfate permease-like transporter
MLAFAIILPGCLRLIPVSALASILVLTGLRLMQVSTIRKLWMESRSEGCICISVAITVVALDLLTGAFVGVALTVLKLVFSVSKLSIVRRSEIGDKDVVIALEGAATFLCLPRLASVLEGVSAQANMFIDIERLTYIDHSCFLLLKSYEKQRVASGGKLELDWAALRLGDNTSQRPSRPIEDEVCDIDLTFDSRGEFRRAA